MFGWGDSSALVGCGGLCLLEREWVLDWTVCRCIRQWFLWYRVWSELTKPSWFNDLDFGCCSVDIGWFEVGKVCPKRVWV